MQLHESIPSEISLSVYLSIYVCVCVHVYILLLFSCQIMSDCLWPHGLQHTRLPSPSPSPRVCPSPCPLSQWCHPNISSVALFFCLQSCWASGSLYRGFLGGKERAHKYRRCKRCRCDPWVGKILLEEGMGTHSSILTQRTPQRSLVGYKGLQRVRNNGSNFACMHAYINTHKHTHTHTHIHTHLYTHANTTYTHVYIYTYTIYMHMHIYMIYCMHVHTYIHTVYIHKHTHIYMHVLYIYTHYI